MTSERNDVDLVKKSEVNPPQMQSDIDRLQLIPSKNLVASRKKIIWIVSIITIVCIVLSIVIGVPIAMKMNGKLESIANLPLNETDIGISTALDTTAFTVTNALLSPTTNTLLTISSTSSILTTTATTSSTTINAAVPLTTVTNTVLSTISLTTSMTTLTSTISETTLTTSSASSTTTTTITTTSTTSVTTPTTSTTRTTTTTTTTTTRTTTTTTPVPPNLLVNPGAESALTGWTQIGPAMAVRDTGTINRGYNPRTGAGMFAGGSNSNASWAGLSQTVNLLGGIQNLNTAQLDARVLKVEISFYYQNYYSALLSSDAAQVTVNFLSATNTTLNTVDSGLQICGSGVGWCTYFKVQNLTTNTRRIQYTMKFLRNGGYDIDSYIDDNSLRVI